MRFFRILAIGVAALAAFPAGAQRELIDQRVEGWKRICVYEETRRTVVLAETARRSAIEIGRGEPCPYRFTPPRKPRQRSSSSAGSNR